MCWQHFRKEDCEMYTTESGNMTYPICPNKCSKHHLRVASHNKRWKEYYKGFIPSKKPGRPLKAIVVEGKEEKK